MTHSFMKRSFRAAEQGVVAIIFAMCFPMIIAASGIAVDLAQAYNVKSRLSDALDKAALAAGSTNGTAEEVEERVTRFFNANYPEEKLGTPYDLTVTTSEDAIVTVSARARVPTTFMGVLGQEEIEIQSETAIKLELRGLEVVMVLDNTGSMANNNNIAAARTAATNFINILFDATNDPSDIRIGMVPYASAVRVGCYGIGQGYDPATGQCAGVYDGGATFVSLPPGVGYAPNHGSSNGWNGCVIEHKSQGYNAAATHVTGSFGQLWRTGPNCSGSADCSGHGWDPVAGNNDPYPNDIPDSYQGPWDIYMYGTVRRNTSTSPNPCGGWNQPSCVTTVTYSFNKDSVPNRNCPHANLIPMTSDKGLLLANVNAMQAEGSTLSNTGLAWGYRVLSPDVPFREGVAWDDPDWHKAVLIMTDGETSMGGNYTAYWATAKNNITDTVLDQRLSQVCAALKNRGVTVYTVTFAAGVPEATKQVYKDCATTEAFYFDAPSQQDLITVFENIARQLSNLHIVK